MDSLIYPWNQSLWESLTQSSERSSHALLFAGGRGLGKRALALALAQRVLTQDKPKTQGLIDAGSHPDFHVLLPESEVVAEDLLEPFARRYLEPHGGKPRRVVTIDQIRQLGQALTTHPHISKTRVVLMYCAEGMNRNAANALLKNLEEPPANTLFILVSNHHAALAKTIRSRCSLIGFRAPQTSIARKWLLAQKVMPEHAVDSHLAMANNHPLLALSLFKEDYIDSLKAVFTGVNSLWNNKQDVVSVARSWQQVGGARAVDILQKLSADLLRHQFTDEPQAVFFPVQASWVKSSSAKLSREKILGTMDELVQARKMLATSVDELLVLETLSIKFKQLPAAQ